MFLSFSQHSECILDIADENVQRSLHDVCKMSTSHMSKGVMSVRMYDTQKILFAL